MGHYIRKILYVSFLLKLAGLLVNVTSFNVLLL